VGWACSPQVYVSLDFMTQKVSEVGSEEEKRWAAIQEKYAATPRQCDLKYELGSVDDMEAMDASDFLGPIVFLWLGILFASLHGGGKAVGNVVAVLGRSISSRRLSTTFGRINSRRMSELPTGRQMSKRQMSGAMPPMTAELPTGRQMSGAKPPMTAELQIAEVERVQRAEVERQVAEAVREALANLANSHPASLPPGRLTTAVAEAELRDATWTQLQAKRGDGVVGTEPSTQRQDTSSDLGKSHSSGSYLPAPDLCALARYDTTSAPMSFTAV